MKLTRKYRKDTESIDVSYRNVRTNFYQRERKRVILYRVNQDYSHVIYIKDVQETLTNYFNEGTILNSENEISAQRTLIFNM